MEHPLSLISAQVHFMDDQLTLVHIPLDLYPFFVQPILRLLFNDVPAIDDQDVGEEVDTSSQGFLNLSLTPVECSVVCSRQLANKYFVPLASKFNKLAPAKGSRVSISKDDFIVMQVDGQGLDAGQRALELTSPLAMAGISIFFISTYFSDYILVPSRSKEQVVRALEKRGFTFEVNSDAFVNNLQSHFYPTSPHTGPTQHSPPVTPPPSTLSELQTRTFASLRKHNIVPCVDKSLRLVQCAAHHRDRCDVTSSSILRPALTTALLVDRPRFLSLTLTPADPAASILLEKRLLPRFSTDPALGAAADEESSLLLGSKEDILVPIMLDLRDLPLEATGIVCGVAGRLAAATHSREDNLNNILSGFPSPIHESKRFSFDSAADMSHLSSSVSSLAVSMSSESSSSSSSKEDFHAAAPIPVPGTDDTVDDTANTLSHSQSLHHLEPEPNWYPDAVEISFLSTARAGTVLVGERELDRAVEALEAESREPGSVSSPTLI
ncbi:hypothetical protein VTN77DRAFT_2595 [Rasamsonia byssochlamydoides]|uniref:uncharacterized protein n=1 Tax=Rasamsonia byssochlamydoides TaxID=89139 RepID=UPI0037427C77